MSGSINDLFGPGANVTGSIGGLAAPNANVGTLTNVPDILNAPLDDTGDTSDGGGIGAGGFAGTSAPTGSTATQEAASTSSGSTSGGFFSDIEGSISSFGGSALFVVVGIILLIAGLFALVLDSKAATNAGNIARVVP